MKGHINNPHHVSWKLLALVIAFLIAAGADKNSNDMLQIILTSLRSKTQSLWIKIIETFGQTELAMYCTLPLTVHLLSYWILSCFYLILDITGKPRFLTKYKIQSDRNVPLSVPDLWKCLSVVIPNSILVAIVIYLYYPIMSWVGLSRSEELPSLLKFAYELLGCIVLEEFMFYYMHRFLHNPVLYKHIHKMHHEWIAPIAVSALYAHPLEHIPVNILTVVVGPTIMRCHVVTLCVWTALATTNTVQAHCGYHFPGLMSQEAHDYHHLSFTQCYGFSGILDRFHKTNEKFLRSVQSKRNKIFYHLTPIKELIPAQKNQ